MDSKDCNKTRLISFNKFRVIGMNKHVLFKYNTLYQPNFFQIKSFTTKTFVDTAKQSYVKNLDLEDVIKNLDLEKEVGGFRFVAEAFGVELKNVVKFFIFLIVIVFDPLAVALIIAFNGLIETKKQKQRRLLGEMMEHDQKLGLYDNLDELMEKNYEIYGDNGKNSPKKEETPIIVENNPQETEQLPNLQWEEFMHPDFPWAKKQLWINNPKAVQYWISTKKGTEKDYSKMLNEEENTKTY